MSAGALTGQLCDVGGLFLDESAKQVKRPVHREGTSSLNVNFSVMFFFGSVFTRGRNISSQDKYLFPYDVTQHKAA